MKRFWYGLPAVLVAGFVLAGLPIRRPAGTAPAAGLTNGGTIGGDLTVNGDAGVAGNTTIGGAFTSGAATHNGDLTVNGDAGVGKNVSIGGALGVTGGTTLTGLTDNGDAGVVGNVTVGGGLYTSNVVLDGGARVCFTGTGACSTNYLGGDGFGKTNVAGPLALNNNLEVLGTSTFTDYGNFSTGLRNTGTGGACTINSDVCVNDGLSVTGAAAVTGAVTAGGVTLSTGTSLVYAAACDSTGSPGAATCNQGVGRAAIAASAASVTITNSLSKTTSIIHATLQTTDAVCTGIKSLVPSNGSFVITTNAVCTGNTNVAWGFDSP